MKIPRILIPPILLSGCFVMAHAMAGQPEPVQPPISRAAEGRALFVQNCTHCHGNDASGDGEDGDGPDLRDLDISDARITKVIQKGIKGEMPSFGRKLPDSAVAGLLEYLRTLHKVETVSP